MGCVGWTAVATTAGWIIAGAVVLSVVGLVSDRLFGRPKWTPDSYRHDGAPPQERIT
jgi:hypothetical protein